MALVAFAGYSVGQTQSPSAIAAAAPSTSPTIDPRQCPGLERRYRERVRRRVVTVRVDKRASMVPTGMPQLPDDPMFREFFGRRFQNRGSRGARVSRASAPA